MADNTILSPNIGTGDTIRTDDISSVKYPTSKITLGADGVDGGFVSSANPLPISDASGSLTVDGTVAATQSGTWNVGAVTTITNVVHVDDNSSTLTVDAPVGTPVFVRLSDGAAAITTLPVSLASVPSHAVTNAGTFVVQENGAALTALQLIDAPVRRRKAGSPLNRCGRSHSAAGGPQERIFS